MRQSSYFCLMAIDLRKKAAVLEAIQSFAKPKQRAKNDSYSVEGYELHAHPDLVHRLKELMTYTSGARLEFVFGIAVLCTPSGRIFATVGGTSSLELFLPDEVWRRPYPEYGKPWRTGRAWPTRSGPTSPCGIRPVSSDTVTARTIRPLPSCTCGVLVLVMSHYP